MKDIIEEENKKYEEKVGLVDTYSESKFCYSFIIQSQKYIESGDIMDMLIGGGPVIVDRRSGRVINTSSGVPGNYFENYEKRGDPYNYISTTIRISGKHNENRRTDSIRYIYKLTKTSLAESKAIIDNVLNGGHFDFEAGQEDFADKYVFEIKQFGFEAVRIPAFDAYPEKYKSI